MATQYYYDVKSDEVHIAVEEYRREEARRCLREFSPDVYQIVAPWHSSYQSGCDSPIEEKGGQQIQMELYPGHRIHKTGSRRCVLFSGSIINREHGITVAHAIDPEDDIEIQCESDTAALAHERIIGKCRETFENLQRQSGGKVTADLALLELDTDRCSVGNTVRWPWPGPSRALQIKICKEQRIPDDTRVIILCQNGNFQSGCIRRESLTDVTIQRYDGGLCDVLGIGLSEEEEVAVTQEGDSGALVMSLPNSETDVIYVYGIAIGRYRTGNEKSLTIANSLWKVIHEISTNENYSAALSGVTQNIDFA